jgi:hypothetical protein
MMRTLLFHPRPAVLTGSKFRREPVRPKEHQSADFADKFDDRTLLFDSFFRGDNEVLIVAPPFFNLLPFVREMDVVALPSSQKCQFRIRNMDRHAQIRVVVPTGTKQLTLHSPLGRFELESQQDLSDFFEGSRVIFTLSKNNKLQWIQDWVRYNRDIHGADAVLLYDNQSTSYSPEELLQAISEISGIERVCVVFWPFLYGPQGLDATRFWDSDFCQNGAWEHARWVFLRQARSTMNSDIDELVVSANGASIFEAAERSWTGVVRYPGVWVYGLDGITRVATDEAPIRFVNFFHFLQPSLRRKWRIIPAQDNLCATKWTVVPRRCPEHAQWTAHRIRGWINALPQSGNFSFRHFREINDHWKYDRSARERFDPDLYAYDRLIRSNYASVRWST